jgi:hypothetical protein
MCDWMVNNFGDFVVIVAEQIISTDQCVRPHQTIFTRSRAMSSGEQIVAGAASPSS